MWNTGKRIMAEPNSGTILEWPHVLIRVLCNFDFASRMESERPRGCFDFPPKKANKKKNSRGGHINHHSVIVSGRPRLASAATANQCRERTWLTHVTNVPFVGRNYFITKNVHFIRHKVSPICLEFFFFFFLVSHIDVFLRCLSCGPFVI